MSSNENLTLNREPRKEILDRVSEWYFYIGYYGLYIILFNPNLILVVRT